MLVGWDYQNIPITKDVTSYARWEVLPKYSNFELNFYTISGGQQATIRNVKDKTIIQLIIPADITAIEYYAFKYCNLLESIVLPKEVVDIGYGNFCNSSFKTIYYMGSNDEFSKIKSNGSNDYFYSATVYYFTEIKPMNNGNYWHYVDGVPTIWGEN